MQSVQEQQQGKQQQQQSPGLNFDQILSLCGDFGPYQYLIIFLFGYLNLLISMHFFSQTIAAFVPNHWCYHEKLKNMSFEDIKKVYSNLDDPSCTKLDQVYSIDNVTVSSELCTRWFYDYDYDFGFRSMNAELNWVCHAEKNSSIGRSFFFIGCIVGTLVFGYLADRIGRLPVLIIANFCGFLGELLTRYSSKTWSFTICRFISGLASDTNIYLMQVIVIEYINPKWRTLGLNLMIGIFYTMGVVSLPWIAVRAGNWRIFFCCTSFPLLSVSLYYCVVQESALWLLMHNNIDGAIKRLKVVAKTNRRKVTEKDFDEFRRYFEAEKLRRKNTTDNEKESFFDLFRKPRMRKITFILFFEFLVMHLINDGVSRNMEGVGISAFVMFSVTGLILLPASLVLIGIQNRLGRKGSSSISMFFAGVVTTTTGLILAYDKETNPVMILILTMIARSCAGLAYDSGAQFAAEIIPSNVRGQSIAVIHVMGFSGSFTVPYIVLLGKYFKPAPPLILGMFSFVGSFLYLFLPETTKKILPKTIEEGEEFGKDEKMFYFVCCERRSNTNEN